MEECDVCVNNVKARRRRAIPRRKWAVSRWLDAMRQQPMVFILGFLLSFRYSTATIIITWTIKN